jgi:serine phosphatase RsbU (regulator of sigma subunit)
VALALACLGLLAAGAFVLFRSHHLLLDAASPGAGLALVFGSMILLTLAEANREKRALEHEMQLQRERSARIAGELDAARRIQTGTLPRADAFRGDRRFDLAASMEPAAEVGGDLYDFFRLDDRRLFFMVGDVAGKGLSASIFMAVSKALYKASMLRTPAADIATLMSTANVEIARDNPEFLFVTAFAGVLDLDTGELAYCNAGHEYPWASGPDDAVVRRIDGGGGPPLCVVDDFAYAGSRWRMRPGELLVVVSDGVTEALDPAGRLYGTERVATKVLALRSLAASASAVVDAVRADVKAYVAGSDPSDDTTVLALRWLGAPGDAAERG